MAKVDGHIRGIKRIGVISFSMIYLLLALTYVHLLPNYNQLTNNGYYSVEKSLVMKAGTGVDTDQHHTLMRKLFYAVPENKRQLIPALMLFGMAVTALFVVAAAASSVAAIHGNLAAYAVLHRHTYLQYRSLRL